MKQYYTALERAVRRFLRAVALFLNEVSTGHITPAMVTVTGLLLHIPVALLIARGELIWGAVLLVVFGLFDTLDGELARLQNSSSDKGGLLDAVTDRFKEVLLYSGVAYYITTGAYPSDAVWAVAACGASLCVSYVKAKGEAIMSSSSSNGSDGAEGVGGSGGKTHFSYPELNRLFAGGLMSFSVRMAVLAIGLLTGWVVAATAMIAILSALTALQRLAAINRRIS